VTESPIRQRLRRQLRPEAVLDTPRVDPGMGERLVSGAQIRVTKPGEARLSINYTLTVRERDLGVVEMYRQACHGRQTGQSPFM